MKTNTHLLSHLAQFFLEWEMFQTKFVAKIKTHILCSVTVFRKSCRLWDNVEKYCKAGQATVDNITRRMRFACWITKATHTHSEYVIFIAFPWQQWLHGHASMLRYTYTACLLNYCDIHFISFYEVCYTFSQASFIYFILNALRLLFIYANCLALSPTTHRFILFSIFFLEESNLLAYYAALTSK
jgi:hypothetical protein